MTAPRAREHAEPPAPPDLLPPRRGGRPSTETPSAAGRPAGFARPCAARRGLVRSARSFAAAALLAALGAVALPATAQAQVTEIWTATLTVGAGAGGGSGTPNGFCNGCVQSGTGTYGTLSDDDFVLGSGGTATTHTFTSLRWGTGAGDSDGSLFVELDEMPPEATTDTWTLHIGSDSWPLADGSYTNNPNRKRFFWAGAYDPDSATAPTPPASGSQVTVKITSGTTSTPTLSIADAAGDEGGNVTFTWTLSPAAAATVTATWTASIETGDTAVAADLGTTTTGTVSVSMGTTTGTFTVLTTEDSLDEDDETFTVTLSNVSSNAQLAADPTAKGTITDDDNLPELAIGFGGGSEASVPALTVSLTPASGREVMVTWTATIESHDTAEAADFTDLSTATGTVTIPAGQSSILLFVPGVIDDSLDEDDETFTLTLSSPVNATLSTTQTVGRVTIRDDDDPPTVTVADGTASEGDKVEFVVTLSAESGRDVEVDYATSVGTGQTATSGTDFTAASSTLTIEEGDETGTIEVQTTDDSTEEEDETFTLTISDPANATLGTKTAAKGTIEDDDGTTLSTDATLSGLWLGTGVTLSPAFASGTATYTASVANSVDEVTVTAIENHASADSEIQDADGNALTDADTNAAGFQVALAVGSNVIKVKVTAADGTSTQTYTATVTRAALTPTLSVADAAAVTEGSPATFTVTLAPASAEQVTVNWTPSGGSGNEAQPALDFTAGEGTLTFAPGDTTKMVTVETLDDALDEEAAETFRLALSNPTNALLAGGVIVLNATGTINDDDEPPTLSVADVSAEEGNSLTFTVTLSAESGRQVTVAWAAATLDAEGDDAEEGTDFTAGSGTLTFTGRTPVYGDYSELESTTPGQTEKTFTVATTDDMAEEMAETFTVTLSGPTNAGISDATAKGTITDNDGTTTPTCTLNAGDLWCGVVVVGTFTDSGGSTLGHGFMGTTGGLGEDVEDRKFRSRSAPPNRSATAATDGKGRGWRSSGTPVTVRLREEDPPTLSVADAAGAESDDKVVFTVTLSKPRYAASSATWTASIESGDTAVAADLGTTKTGTVAIAARATTATFEVPVTDDSTDENDETFTVTLSAPASPESVKLATDATAKGTINDDDGTLTPTKPDAPTGFAAGVGNAQVALTWDAPASGANITRHEFRQKTGGGSYPTTWTAIATSAPGGTNEASFTVTGLTNEIAHTFELRAVNDSGGGAAVEDGPVTPTPGICDRTAKIQEVILAELSGVTDCAAVTVANLASITTFGFNGFGTFNQGITSLQAGDFAGLTALTILRLGNNQLASLPAGIFSGLTAITSISLDINQLTALPEGTFAALSNLTDIDLAGNDITQIPAGLFTGLTSLDLVHLGANELTAIPAGLFTGLMSLTEIELGENDLSSLDAGVFSGLTALKYLGLAANDLSSLPAGLFTGFAVLEGLDLSDNDLTRTGLPAGLFSDLTALQRLRLNNNKLESLPDGLLSGLTGLTRLQLLGNPNTGDVLPLAVTVEKVGTDQARAEVLAGAPVAVAFKATVANGSLAGGATTLGVAAGSVEGTPVTVTRTSGTTESVTVDIDLSTQPSVPANHTGYEFVKATSGLPAGILPAVGNNAPVFDPATAEREVPENSAAGTNVGAVIPEATDADSGDTLTYSLEGTDARSFAFNASTRRITTRENVTYNYEAKSSYSVRVKASDGTDSATLAVTIGLTDVLEQSARPAKPRLSPVRGSTTSLSARWTRPGLNGGPAITGYDVQYREAPAGGWREWAHGDATRTTTITGLTAGRSYQARVRAKNGERDSEWSEASEAVVPSAAITPTVAAVSVTSVPELERDTYGRGETIRFTVEFSEKVVVAGAPHFTFSLGNRGAARRVDAAYESGSGMAALVFAYTVREGEEDDNGIFLMDGGRFDDRDGPVALAGGAITAVEGGAAADLSWSGGGTERGHKVDGSRALEGDAPTVVGRLKVTSWPVRGGAAYGVGDTIVFTLTFSEKVRVKGQPQPALVFELGGEEREARYHGLSDTDYEAGSPAPAPRSEAVKLHFAYRVGAGDRDDDGVSVGADAVRPGDATIRSAVTGFDADLSHAAVAPDPDHRVAAGTATEPAGPGVTIIDAKGNPLAGHRLVIPEGGQGRYGLKLNTRPAHPVHLKAIMSDGDEDLAVLPSFTQPSIAPGAWGAPRWVDIAAADDADSVDGERVFLHRVHSKDPAYNDLLLPDVVVVEADDDPKESGPPPPEITAVAVASEPELESDTYGYGETIRFRVEFSEPVTVGGQPHFTFSLGNRNAGRRVDAPYESGNRTTALVFGYEVQRGDEDDNGIFLLVGRDFTDRAGPVGLGRGGLILAVAGGVAADLAHDTGRGAQRGHQVDGSRPVDPVPTPPTNPTVDSLAVNSWPQSGGEVYRSGDTIVFTVTFSEKVRVEEGQPALAFDLGGAARWGVYHGLSDDDYEEGGPAPTPRSEAAKLHFAYQVDRFDRDADGVEVGELSGAMDLRRGTIRSAETGLDADLGHAAVGPLSDPVDGLAAEPATTAEPLTAEFEGLPSEHDGRTAFRFRIEFSEEVAVSAAAMRDDALTVSGGTVTGAARVDGRADRWSIEVTPSGRGEIGISLPPGPDCAEAGAVCTADGRPLTTGLAALVAGPPVEPLTASFEGMPAEHGGEGGLHFRVAFSEDIGISYRSLREDAFAVSGGRVTGGRRVDDRRDLFRMTVRPDSDGDVTITLPAGRECGVSGAICTKGDDRRQLTNSPSATVTGPVGIEVADARVEEGDGAVLAFLVTLSRAAGGTLTVDYATANGSAHAGVDYRAASGTLEFRAGESSKTVEVTVFDDSHDEGEETLTLRLSNASSGRVTDGEATGTIKNSDPLPRALLARFGRTAAVQVVEQVEARLEASREPGFRGRVAGRELRRGMERDIALGLIRRLGGAAGVGRGVAGVGASGAMAGASGAAGFLPPGTAGGRRRSAPALPMRAAGSMGAVATGGASGSTGAGSTGGAAGSMGMAPSTSAAPSMGMAPSMRGASGSMGMGAGPMGGPMGMASMGGASHPMGMGAGPMGGPMGMAGPMGGASGSMGMATRRMGGASGGDGWLNGRGFLEMGLGGGDVLTGSAFTLNRESGRGGVVSLWSRGARSRFSGREGALSLGGDVRTTMFGADYARGPLVVGLSLSNTRGVGEYTGPGSGRMLSSVTGLYPWLGYRATDRITVWGVTGYGVGGMLLTPGGGPALESGLSTAMAAAGTRGELVGGGGGNGFALAFKADALWAGTAIDGVDGPEGRLVATSAAVTRVRTGLEGSRGFTFGGGLSLRPSVEVGLRHDGGDAETGAGVDVGGGLVASHASSGLAVDVRVRTLLVHEAEGFSERGVSLSLSWNPTPSTPLGLTARLAPSWGGQATSGADALWGRDTMGGLGAPGGLASGNRLDAELGYGLPVGRRFVGTPRFGLRTSGTGRDYRLGYGLGVLNAGGLRFELGVDAQRRESQLAGGASNGVVGRVAVQW